MTLSILWWSKEILATESRVGVEDERAEDEKAEFVINHRQKYYNLWGGILKNDNDTYKILKTINKSFYDF